jgi:hypothetical protein
MTALLSVLLLPVLYYCSVKYSAGDAVDHRDLTAIIDLLFI